MYTFLLLAAGLIALYLIITNYVGSSSTLTSASNSGKTIINAFQGAGA